SPETSGTIRSTSNPFFTRPRARFRVTRSAPPPARLGKNSATSVLESGRGSGTDERLILLHAQRYNRRLVQGGHPKIAAKRLESSSFPRCVYVPWPPTLRGSSWLGSACSGFPPSRHLRP